MLQNATCDIYFKNEIKINQQMKVFLFPIKKGILFKLLNQIEALITLNPRLGPFFANQLKLKDMDC